MALSFLYLMARRLVDMLPGRLRSHHAKEVQIAVLRHQLAVLRRQVKRPQLRPADRAALAVLSRALPRRHWSIFLVTPGHDPAVAPPVRSPNRRFAAGGPVVSTGISRYPRRLAIHPLRPPS